MNKRPSSINQELPADLDGHQGPAILSVSELSVILKHTVEEVFSAVRVRGEITGFKRAPSGHLYFRLKDEDAVLDGVCWRGTAGRLSIAPEDGMEVIATGRLTTYQGRSNYQIVVDAMEMAGEGALLKLLQDRRKKLDQEGLFDEDNKQDIPFLPDVIGVVTSPTGAVIRDILHRLDDRFPRHVLLWPVKVQGDDAADEIAAAIEGFNRLSGKTKVPRPNVLIVARGGGSLEDLMAFNEEIVVRAAAASTIPLISAVGHETDTTLIDFAADERAPTPSAAAERAVPVRAELLARLQEGGARLTAASARMIEDARLRLDSRAQGLPDLGRIIEELFQRLDDWTERLVNASRGGMNARRGDLAGLAAQLPRPNQQLMHARSQFKREVWALRSAGKGILKDSRQTLKQAAALLESYSYERVLERGFALIADEARAPLVSVKSLKPGMGLTMRFHDGEAGATVEKVGSGKKPKKTPKKKAGNDPQGKLL